MKNIKIIWSIFVVLLSLNLVHCVKSSNEKSINEDTNNGTIGNSSFDVSTDDNEGIKITINNVPLSDGMDIVCELYDEEIVLNKYGKYGVIAAGKGYVNSGSVDIYLLDNRDTFDIKPLTKPGAYRITVSDRLYTNGKTLKELDLPLRSIPMENEDIKKWPTYNLKDTGNFIDYAKDLAKWVFDDEISGSLAPTN